jgi:hypothetical protein
MVANEPETAAVQLQVFVFGVVFDCCEGVARCFFVVGLLLCIVVLVSVGHSETRGGRQEGSLIIGRKHRQMLMMRRDSRARS